MGWGRSLGLSWLRLCGTIPSPTQKGCLCARTIHAVVTSLVTAVDRGTGLMSRSRPVSMRVCLTLTMIHTMMSTERAGATAPAPLGPAPDLTPRVT